jgi:3D (Asp-Asp-Asp) domain-containing protein
MITGYSNTISVTTLETPLLLDLYPSAAAAYSVRKLRNAYSGSAIRVRRSSDNTEQDIGFSSDNLDATALTTFCSGTDGFVTTWYDQSGNSRNATNTTAADQPQIVSSGSIINVNSKPSIKFQDSGERLQYNGSGTSVTNTMATVQKFNTLSGYGVAVSIGHTGTTSCYALLVAAGNLRSLYSISQESRDGTATTNQEIWGSTTATSNAKFWLNGTSETITNSSVTYTAGLNQIMIGGDTFGSSRLPNMQEAIYWTVTQSDTDLVGINTNQNTYFNVY